MIVAKRVDFFGIFWWLLLVLPLLVFFFIRLNENLDVELRVPVQHFYIVSAAALAALFLGVLTAVASSGLRDAQVFFLSLAFISIAAVFSVHGLTTPRVLVPGPNPVIGFSARLSVFLGAVFFMLSTIPWRGKLRAYLQRWQGKLTLGWAALLLGYGLAGLLAPHLIAPFSFFTSIPWSFGLGSLTIVLYVAAAWYYWQTFVLARLPLQLALTTATVLLAESQVAMFAPTWHLSWWSYHGFMLAGFLIAVLTLLSEYFRGRGVISIMRDLFVLEGIVELELEHQETIAALAAATEAKDPYTHGHTVRVAQHAVQIGKVMNLPSDRLRVLARAGLLHDVGKLGIRDAVLLKPDKLTDEEFRHIQEHPKMGHDILRRAGSLEVEISVITAHHERMDGTGYPLGLKAVDIPLEARILAVADVFDALTSKRPYRNPMSEEEALEVIQNESGTHFDPACADAFVRSRNADTAA